MAIPDWLKLSETEIDHLLRTEKTLRIATQGPEDAINLTPMTFGWTGSRIYIFGRGQKVANLRRNSTATVLIDVGEKWRELQGVMIQGEARVLEPPEDELADPDLASAQPNLGQKHGLGSAKSPKPYSASAAGRSRRWIVFTPEKYVSWNNERLEHKSGKRATDSQ